MGAVTMPRRVQRKRTKGARLPEGVVYVGRPTRWGNDWHVVHEPGSDSPWAVRREYERGRVSYLGLFATRETASEWAVRGYWTAKPDGFAALVREQLAGKDLACWCPLLTAGGEPFPCHVDVLLQAANSLEAFK